MLADLFFGQVGRLSQHHGIEFGTGAQFQGFKTLVGVHQIFPAQNDPMVFHDDGFVIGMVFELSRDFLTKPLAARRVVGSEPDATANTASLRDDVGVRNFVGDAERNQCGRMGVNDRLHTGTHLVDRFVEGILRRRFVRADDGTICLDAHDILFGQGAFVDAAGRDPHIAAIVHDGDVAARGGRHPAAVDTPDDHFDLLCGVHQFRV